MEIRSRGNGKEIIIKFETRPKFLWYKPNREYILAVDLQRFPPFFKKSRKKGYWYTLVNVQLIQIDGKDVKPEWYTRLVWASGNVNESEDRTEIEPRVGSELWQLLAIQKKYSHGIHKCLVKTREGKQKREDGTPVVIAEYIHLDDCNCLKSKKSVKEESPDKLEIHHPKEIADKDKKG